MELYSKEELLKELKKEYSCGGECDHCPEVLDAGSCSVLRCIRRIIDSVTTISIDLGIAGGDRTVYASSQGEWLRKEDVIHSIAKQYSEHNELVPIWLSIGDMKGGAEE